MTRETPRMTRLSLLGRFLSISRLFLWILWRVYCERRRVINTQVRGNEGSHFDGDALVEVMSAFCKAAVKQGVLLIKLGQFLSTRIDLLPEQAIAVLSSLQDEVPPAPFVHVVSIIESELGKPVEQMFCKLERKCAAAASLGQVYQAVLASSGETVAVKIQRPHIDQLVRLDLLALRFVIWGITRFINTNHFIDLKGIYREFERTIYEEIDYVREAANAKRFQELFNDDPTIYIPRVYDQYISRRVLVLEWIDGIKINAHTALDAAGINRLELAKRMVKAYFFQFFEAGFFHADPHPGNLLVKQGPSGDEPIVTFVDFGMVGSYTKQTQRYMKEVFLAVLASDSRSLVTALAKLGFVGEGANLALIERSIARLLEKYSDMTLGEVTELGLTTVLQDIGQLLYRQSLRIPAQFAFTGRAIGLLTGVAMGLAPEFNFIEVATPYARRFLGLDARRMGRNVQEFFTLALDAGRALLALPQELEQILMKLDTGQIEVTLVNNESSGGRSLRGRKGKRNNGESSGGFRFACLFIFASSLASGIFLLTDGHQLIAGWFFLALAGLCALRAVLKM